MIQLQMQHDVDPKEQLLSALGDVSHIELMSNQILLAVYIRPEKTKSGLYLSDRYREEDRFQSKIGLLVARGPSAFSGDDQGEWFGGRKFSDGEWILFRPSDGWSVTVNGVSCKIMTDTQVKGVVDNPDRVW